MIKSYSLFDGQEREFRGFGMVEQWDTEDYQIIEEGDNHPLYTKTWFHTGFYKNSKNISDLYKQEYYNAANDDWLLPDTILPENLGSNEIREAARVLKGSILRQEIYSQDESDKENIPYTVTENSFKITVIQNTQSNKHAVFTVLPEESININYERELSDPRIVHTLNLEYDNFSNPLKQITIAYKRLTNVLAGQDKTLVSIKENTFYNSDSSDSFYRISVPISVINYETQDFENYSNKIALSDFANYSSIAKTKLQEQKTLYYNEDCTAELGLGSISSHALPYRSLTFAMNDDLINQHILADGRTNAPSASEFKAILVASGYIAENNNTEYWMPSERAEFDIANFYIPINQIDALGNETSITYDIHKLLPVVVTDALNNSTQIINDYLAMQPIKITDPNGNGKEIELDELGMPIKQAIYGSTGEGDTLTHPTLEYTYDLNNWLDNAQPIKSYIKARTEHGSSCTTFLETYEYSDGLGRSVLIKTTAEDGLAWQLNPTTGIKEEVPCTTRFVATGRIIYNNKGKTIKQYEPWFSTNSNYEAEDELMEYGVTPVMQYDPAGRLIKTDFPDGTKTELEFNAWYLKNYDQNDCDINSDHYNTPQTVYISPLGKAYKTVDDNGTYGNNVV